MRNIIHNYKLRLTNLSQGNRSLKLGRLSSRRDIDLKDLGFLEKDTPEEILSKIIAGKNVKLINKLDPRFEPTNKADYRLNRIYRTVHTLFEETGTYDLFVGYPFVEGKFLDGTVVRCPVLLFPVRLIKNLQGRPRWNLEIIKEEPVTFNKTFFLAYEQFQQMRLKPEFWEEEIQPHDDWMVWINQLYQTIKSYEIEVNFNARLFDLELNNFPDYLKATMDGFRTGVLTFKPQAVLGLFPQSDSALLSDYQQIEQQSKNYDLAGLFGKGDGRSPMDDRADTYIKEENRYFVTEVDQSQENALIKIKQGKSLLVHGPPGTGKSQLIVNIIADAMAHGKKVLLVSQKRAALDVVYKRLSALGLSRFAVLVHDYRHDRASIYQKIKRQIDNIDTFQKEINDLNITKWEHDYKLLSRQTDQLNRTFEELFEALTSYEEVGISLHELYLNCDANQQILSLSEIARKLNRDSLEQLLEKLAVITDYGAFFEENYPWRKRNSFRHYGQAEQMRVLEWFENQPGEINRLHQNYLKLSNILGPRLLDQKLNTKRINLFLQVDKWVESHVIREGMESIHREKHKAEELENILVKFEKALHTLDERAILNDHHWKIYESLVKHVKQYKKSQGKALRLLSFPYLRARWFLNRIVSVHSLKLDKTTFKQLEREVRRFQQLHRHYAKYLDDEFLGDFPLLSPQNEKWDWLEKKKDHLECYRTMTGITFFRKIKPRFDHGTFAMGKWMDAMKWIGSLEKFTRSLIEQSRVWNQFLHSEQIAVLQDGIKQPGQALAFIEKLKSTFKKDFHDLKNLDIHLASFTHTEQNALEILQSQINANINEKDFLKAIKNSIYFYWIEHLERLHPVLVEVSGRGWSRKEQDFANKLRNRRKQVTELIQRRIKENIIGIIEYNRLKNPVTYRQIHHQVSKKRLIWSVRKLVSETWHEGLNQLVPCWMASPESVSAIFPLETEYFDYVVFDEASQCYVERAIPVMLRGKQVVIAGDEKQLQPLDLYKVRYDDSEAAFAEDEIALEVESILDLAKTIYEPCHLTWHYRSQQEALINFSNYTFYDGRLQLIPPAVPDPRNLPPLEWISVNGLWKNNCNLPEAEQVIDLILQLIRRPDSPSIGIVTFNFYQQELIKDLIDQKLEYLAEVNKELYQLLESSLSKTEEEEFQGLFVKNIENVQGDERDIIIFSIGYAKNPQGKLISHFGLLNQKGGENRLNVAITRARLKNYIVCSFLPADLKVEEAINPGPKLLKKYLTYARKVSEGQQDHSLSLIKPFEMERSAFPSDNPIADYLASTLVDQGYFVIRDFGDTSFKLDLAIKESEEVKEFLLGVICEGPHYFNGETAKEREVYRKNLLINRGWKVHRIWARNFWLNREKEVEKVIGILSMSSV